MYVVLYYELFMDASSILARSKLTIDISKIIRYI
jgi:hypothetical protein